MTGSQSPDTSQSVTRTRPQFQCNRCDKRFRHRSSVKRHQAIRPSCDSPGTNLTNLHLDMDQFCKTLTCEAVKCPVDIARSAQSGTEQYRCLVCSSVFSSQDKLQIHGEELQARLQCCRCNKTLGNRAKLVTHHRKHTDTDLFNVASVRTHSQS